MRTNQEVFCGIGIVANHLTGFWLAPRSFSSLLLFLRTFLNMYDVSFKSLLHGNS
jgi:hypothetical protein